MSYLVSGGAILAALGTIFGNALVQRPSVYRYRMTVDVDTPSGVRSGSAVRELVYRKAPQLTMESKSFELRQRGEAVAVDLPGGQTLFVLLDLNAYDTVIAGLGGGDRRRDVKELLDQAQPGASYRYPGRATLRKLHADFPPIIRFRDDQDPRTLEVIDPSDLEEAFGEGVVLKDITLQLTEATVTFELNQRLPWLDRLEDFRVDPSNQFTSTLPRQIRRLRSL